ncbi:MAG: hypothetical protein ACLFSQ_06880 [Candidatus Zixiibacteriota bacterium]
MHHPKGGGGMCHGGSHGHHKQSGHDCKCGHHSSWRRFRNHEEKVKDLEHYKKELEAELQAVNEILEHLEK